MNPTREDVDRASDELDLINYAAARKAGDSMQAIRHYFGVKTSALERRYQDDLRERARRRAMKPSPHAVRLMEDRRPIFTERRRARRFWRTWWPGIALALLFLWYEFSKALA